MGGQVTSVSLSQLGEDGIECQGYVPESGRDLPADPHEHAQQGAPDDPHGPRMGAQSGLPLGLDAVALDGYRPYIEAALSYAGDTHRYEDVAAMIAAGSAHLWPGPASVIVTELIDYPRKRVLNVFLAAGRLAELEAMLPPLLDWARERGCAGAMFTGRKGWERTFLTKTGGWKATHVLCVKDLTS